MSTRLFLCLVFSSTLLAVGCEQEPKAPTDQASASSTKAPTKNTSETSSEFGAQTSTKPKVHVPLTKRGILEQKLSDLKTSKQRHELLEGHEWVTSFKDNEHETYVELHDGSEIDITYHRKGAVPHL